MGRVLSLKFEFLGATQYALIRVRQIARGKEFHVSVNSDQMRELLGDDAIVIREIDNKLYTDGEICSLKGALLDLISQHPSLQNQPVS